jgi:hypothetical protein
MVSLDSREVERVTARRPLAGIVFKSKFPINSLLSDVVGTLEKRGVVLAGVVQSAIEAPGKQHNNVCLTSLRHGWEIPVLQDRGQLASGCRLDPQAITDVAGRLAADLDAGADLLVINRFGRAESEGYGLRQLLEKAIGSEIPVLLAVREDYVDDLTRFAQDLGELLPPDRDDILTWCDAVCGQP